MIACDIYVLIHFYVICYCSLEIYWTELNLNSAGVEHPIEALLDNPHSIKNKRNMWESLGTVYNSDREAIKWKELYNVQSLRKKIKPHFYHNQKQKFLLQHSIKQ